jgi:hypothetical protein
MNEKISYPHGALTPETWSEFHKQAMEQNDILFWWVDEYKTPKIIKYHTETPFTDTTLENIVRKGRIPLFPNYWFAYAYMLQQKAKAK